MSSALNKLTAFQNTPSVSTPVAAIGSWLSRAASVAHSLAGTLIPKEEPTLIERLDGDLLVIQTPAHHETMATETRQALQMQKESLINEYHHISGRFFQDPASQIHPAWTRFLELEMQYNTTHTTPYARNTTTCTDPEMQPVFEAERAHCELRVRQDQILQELSQLGTTFKSDPELRASLEQRQRNLTAENKALCGQHKKDSASPLYKAYKAYKTAKPAHKQTLLQAYNALETQRRHIWSNLFLNDHMLRSPEAPELSLDSIVDRNIESAVHRIQAQIQKEQAEIERNDRNWNEATLMSISHIFMQE